MAVESNSQSGDARGNYAPTLPYEDKYGLELPRIMVPPPNIKYDGGRASFHVVAEEFHRNDSRCGNPSFLRTITSTYRLEMEHSMLKWNYEGRRTAQQLLPFLFIGPSTVARDTNFVRSNGITMLLAVRSAQATRKHPRYLDPAFFQSAVGVETSTFDLDTPYELITNIRPIVKRINDHLEASCVYNKVTSATQVNGKVMVFCETGNERSAVVVAAYFMLVYGIGAISAIQVVQSQRFCVNVDDGMKSMLLDLEMILTAEKGVAAAHSTGRYDAVVLENTSQVQIAFPKASKRKIDAAYEWEEEESSDAAGGAYEQSHRAGTAPFMDIDA